MPDFCTIHRISSGDEFPLAPHKMPRRSAAAQAPVFTERLMSDHILLTVWHQIWPDFKVFCWIFKSLQALKKCRWSCVRWKLAVWKLRVSERERMVVWMCYYKGRWRGGVQCVMKNGCLLKQSISYSFFQGRYTGSCVRSSFQPFNISFVLSVIWCSLNALE